MNSELAAKEAVPTGTADASEAVFRFPGFEIDPARGELRVAGHAVVLRPKSFELLVLLARNPGRLMTREQLVDVLWPDVIVTADSLVQCISELRAALGDREQSLIRTLPRRGYMLDVQPFAAVAAAEPSASAPESLPDNPQPRTARRRRVLVALSGATALVLAGIGYWWHANQPEANAGASTAQRRSIAVLPFANLSGDPAQDYFAEGVTADVIAALSTLPRTLVVDQTSTHAYRAEDLDLHRVSQELNVRYVVLGGVRRLGPNLHIDARLLAVDTGIVLWSDVLDYSGQRPWSWQRDIGPRVANALNLRMDEMALESPSIGPHDAMEHTMRGTAMLRRSTQRSDYEAAAEEFRAALKLAPNFSAAWAGLSQSLTQPIGQRLVTQPLPLLREAEQAADQAMKFDANNPSAHFAHGEVLVLGGHLDSALAAFQSCIALDPSMAAAYFRIGVILIELGRAGEAIAPSEVTLRLSPRDPKQVAFAHFAIGMALFNLGRDDEAYAEMQKMAAANPRIGFAYQWMAAIDALHGRDAEARENLARYIQLIPIHTISGLKATERSRNPDFVRQRERFYEGLRKAGLPE